MVSINRIHRTIKALSNTDSVGNAKPEIIDSFVNQSVLELYEELFFEVNRLINRQNRGLLNTVLESTTEKIRERIQHYLTSRKITSDSNVFVIPKEVRYFDTVLYKKTFVEQTKNNKEFLLSRDTVTEDYPICLKTTNLLTVLPETVREITISFLRNPIATKWTYRIINGVPVFDNSKNDFYDVDIHPSCEDDLIIRTAQKLGLNLKEKDIQAFTQREELREFNQEATN